MNEPDPHVVTGAFGYSDRTIAQRLLDSGHRVRTATNSHGSANLFGDRIEAHPFHFDNENELCKSLRGAKVLYNTYWIDTRKNSAPATPVIWRDVKSVTPTTLSCDRKEVGDERYRDIARRTGCDRRRSRRDG